MCSALSCAIWLTALLHTPLVCSCDNCHTSLLHNNACNAFYLYLHYCYCNFILFVLFCFNLFCFILFILYCLFYFIVLYCIVFYFILFYFILFYFIVCDYFFLTQYSKIYSQTASNPLQIHFHSSSDPL